MFAILNGIKLWAEAETRRDVSVEYVAALVKLIDALARVAKFH